MVQICHVICTPGTPNDPCFDWSSDLDKLTGARFFFLQNFLGYFQRGPFLQWLPC